MKNEKDYEVVGDIRIKQSNKKKKKKKSDNTSIGTNIFLWVMFIAMHSSFLVPLALYLISVIGSD